MRFLKLLSFTLMLSILGLLPAFATDVTGTINFGSASGSTNVNAASVTGDDSQGNTWTITTAGTTSFTPNASYAQIGSGNKPASSITFTTTLDNDVNISAFSAKFGGFNGTAGTVTLKVDDETVGTGSLSASTDVTVNKSGTTAVTGSVLTVTVTGISKGVKAYYISYTYDGGGATLSSIAISGTPNKTTYEAGENFDPTGLVATGTYSDASTSPIASGITWTACKTESGTYVALDNAAVVLAKDETDIYVKATVSEQTSAAFHVTGLTVTEAPAADNYELVTDVSDLEDAAEIIIVNIDENKALSINQQTNNRAGVAVSSTNHVIPVGSDVQIITLEVSSSNWKFKVGTDSYLYASSGSANQLKTTTATTAGDNGVWAIAIANDGAATIIAQGSNTRNNLRYNPNSGSPIFCCYSSTSTMGLVKIFKKSDGTSKQAAGLAYNAADAEKSVILGETFTAPTLTNPHSLTVSYESDNTAVAEVASNGSVTIKATGKAVITASFAGNDDYKLGSASYTIIVTNHAGTAADPYSVADARTVIDAGIGLADKYVRGIVSEIVEPLNTTYHNISYNFSDDGLTTSNQLEAYRGKSYNGGNFTSNDDIQVGDDVIVFGTLKKYGSTYELDAGNQLVKRSAHLAWSGTTEGAYAASLEGGNTFPTLTNSDNVSVSYSSSETSVATINASNGNIDLVGAGSTNITATFTGNDTYFEKSASYTLNVSSTVIKADILFEENGGSAVTDMQAQSNLPSPLPTTTKAGYNFGGWFTTSTFDAGTEAIAGAAVTSSDPITLYAKWLDPYSVGVALTMINALADNEKTDNVYVIGVVDNHATSLSSTSINYNIKDANASNTLAVYKGKGLKTDLAPTGEDVTSADYVQEGDQVVVYGQLYKYVDKNSNTTPEIAQGSYILSKVRPTTAVTGVTLPETATVRAGKTIALTATIEPSNASNKNVTWSVIAGSDYAEVDANGVVTGKAQGTATIQVETEDGGFTASCTVTVLAGVNFADGDWMLVTDAAELTANSYVIIAAADYGKAMKPYESGNNCKSKDATKSGSMLTYDSDFGVFEIKAGNKENTIALSDADNGSYLYAASSSSNYLKAEDNLSNNSSWAVAVTSAGVATLIAQGNYTRNTLKYNSANDQLLFSCYASSNTSMKDISLYKYYAPVPKVIYNKNTDDEVTNMPGVTRAELEGEVYKATISTTVPHRSGYSFSGWKSGETTYNAGEKYTLTADITLNAQWTQLVGHHVTYVATGTAPTDEKLYYEGDKVTLALATGVSNPGYSFAGWNDGTNTYTAGYEEYVMPDNDVTFTAVWSRMSSQKWALVEDVNNIKTDGTEYIIVATGYDVAMSALSGKIYSTSDVIKNENTKTLTGPESMLKLTFETGSESGKLAIKNGSKYISSTKVKEMTEGDDSFDWEISITDGVATISASVGNIRYNKDYPRFTTYASGQQDVALYVKVPMVEISTDVEASALSENTDVVVHSNGTLTVDDDKTLGDLTVENGGKVVLSNKKLTVTNFVIETTMADHKSGQVDGALTTNFEVMGDAYIDITLGAGGTNQQWHAFTVPFPVDVLNGIYDLADNKLQNEVNYAIMDYHGDIRATGKYGWKKYRATLVPGTFYIMATDGYRTTYRFKKADGAALVAANTKDLHEYPLNGGTDEQHDNGWNGVGNPTLHYGTANQVVQVLNPNTYTYEEFLIGAKNFVVGTPFFVQAAADGTMTFSAEDKTKPYYAPARYSSEEIKDVEVRFGNDEYTDRLYISANEDALNTYETGKDLVKMTMTNTPKVAQIFGNAYNSKLCMVNAPLHNDQAIYSLTLYAPTDGEYTIAIPQVENADIYLTYDNRIIWNIAASEYNCELKAGETNNYGLILRMKAPQVTTDVEQGGVRNGANSVQKIIINDHVYILRGEKLYNVTGKMLR